MKRLIVLILLPFYSNAFAWGVQGHKIIAQVAQTRLSAKALMEISKLIPKQTLPDICVWADQVRTTPEYKFTAPWHYASVDDNDTYERSIHNPAGDVIVAITNQLEILKNAKNPQSQRVEALKFITHFMGDIHQPLHVGRIEDHGGNTIQVNYQGRDTNLHALWDSSFIEEQMLNVDKYVDSIVAEDKNDTLVTKEFTLTQIATEDMSYRQFIYNYSGKIIDATYAKGAKEIVNARLKLGGARLAELLNSAFNY